MIRVFMVLCLAVAACGQSFDVAAVKRNTSYVPAPAGSPDAPPPPAAPPSLKAAPNGVTIENATLKVCLQWAYKVQPRQVSGPTWIENDRYDIRGKTDGPVSQDELRTMLQNLLRERFKLVVRTETKESEVNALVVGKGGSKLKPSAPGSSVTRNVNLRPDGATRIVAQNVGLDFLAPLLWVPIFDPVVDQTGLKGTFDFTFERPPMRAPDAGAMLANLSQALESQLGLKLVPRKLPMLNVVVDRGDKNPIPN